MLVIEQPDGTMTHVPEWMTEPAAGMAEVRDAPRLPLAVLRDLRMAADAALSLLCGQDSGGRHDASQSIHATRPVRHDGTGGRPAAGDGEAASAASAAVASGGDYGRDRGDGGER
jgi:hypothetical protein